MPNRQTNSRGDGASVTELLIAVDRSRPRDLRAQLERALREAIQQGRLPVGAALPPSRTLARELALARSVVVQAYAQLTAEGYLDTRQGSRTRVRSGAEPPPRTPGERRDGASARFRRALPDQASFEGRRDGAGVWLTSGGLPDPALFPRSRWLRHYRAVLDEQPDASFRYPDPQGHIELRRALAAYLGRVRAIRTSPERLLVCAGFAQGLTLLCGVLRSRGVTRVAVEDPCFAFHRRLIAAAGLEAVAVATDEDGLDVARLDDLSVGAVLLAPAHSYPNGAVLSAARRMRLLDWARATDSLVIEDDYDAEFRYDRTPIGALHGLSPEHVVYGSSASKTLSPALRLGWLAAPEHLIGDLLRAKLLTDIATETLGQLALARFIDSGDLARHLRRVRPVYRIRRDALVAALAARLPGAEPAGVAAGLHLFVRLPDDCDEGAFVEAAGRHGVHVEGAARHWADPSHAPPALVLGYGGLHETGADRAVAALAASYADGARTR